MVPSSETCWNAIFDPLDVLRTYLPAIARSGDPPEGIHGAANAAIHGRRLTDGYATANCEVAAMIARRVGLPDRIQAALLQINQTLTIGGNGTRIGSRRHPPRATEVP